MTSTSFATYFSLFKFAYKRDSGMGKVTHAAFSLTTLAGLVFAWKMPDYAQSGYLLSIIAFAGLLVGYWLVFCIGFLLQNSPANACTVPHLHLRIRRLSLSLGLLMSAFFSAVSAFFFGHFFITLALTIASLATLWAYNAYFYGFYFSALFSFKYWLPFLLKNEDNALLLILILGIASTYAWLCLRNTFPQGGDAHNKLYKSLGHLLRQVTPSDNGNNLLQKFDWLYRIFSVFYRRDLNTIIAGRRSTSPRELLSLGFGPGMHYGMDFFMASFVLVYSLQLASNDGDGKDGAFFLSFLLLLTPLLSSFSIAVACKTELYKTKREQALLCLVPILPKRGECNRVLREIILRRFVSNWLVSALCVGLLALVGFALNFTGYAVWMMSLFLSPLFFVHVLRDYSEISQDTVNEMGVAGIALMIIIACFSLKLGEGDFFYGSIAAVTLLVLFSVYLGVNRWRRMLSYSFQLPVGHRKS